MLTFLTIVVGIVIGGAILLISFWYLSHFLSMTAGAPYMKSHTEHIIFAQSQIVGKKKVADIGSGNGGILIALAGKNAQVHGFELNPFLVWLSRRKIARAGLSHRVSVHWGNFWNVSFNDFDAVYVFCIPRMMPRLAKKLRTELPDGATIVSAAFPLADWTPTATQDKAFVYKK